MFLARDHRADFRVEPVLPFLRAAAGRMEVARGHTRPLLLWLTRGQGRIAIGGTVRGYGPFNAIFLPPGTLEGGTLSGQVFGTAVQFPQAMAADLPRRPLQIRLRDAVLQTELAVLVDAMEREVQRRRPGFERAMEHHAGLIAVWLERHADLSEPLPAPGPAAGPHTRADTREDGVPERRIARPQQQPAFRSRRAPAPPPFRSRRRAGPGHELGDAAQD